MTELYLYQIIHLYRSRPRLLERHTALLDAASRELFARPYRPDLKQLEARIATIATSERYPDSVSGFVRLELLPDGTQRLTAAGTSFYKGYALRSITPDAVVFEYDPPLSDAPTSAREAAAQLAHQQALAAGGGVALRTSRNGVCLTADNAPLFAVRNRELFTAPLAATTDHAQATTGNLAPSVEREVALRAVQAAGLGLREEAFRREDLRYFDELFYVDHRGVTALAHCDANPFMSIQAERIATAMEQLFAPRR